MKFTQVLMGSLFTVLVVGLCAFGLSCGEDSEVGLRCTIDDSATDSDSVKVTVNPYANVAPTADAGPDQEVNDADDSGDESVTLDGSGSSDTDGTIVSYDWEEASVPIASGVSPVLVTVRV